MQRYTKFEIAPHLHVNILLKMINGLFQVMKGQLPGMGAINTDGCMPNVFKVRNQKDG
jgi:hypothetical protein